jgi:superfamily II DNA or RNA helicase
MSESFVQTEWRIGQLAEERTRGDAFERAAAHFLRRDPALGMRRVWTWLDWPGRFAAGIAAIDLGIDLVAEDDQSQLVGVQVKFRLDPRSHLRWEEISTALSFRPDLFARRLIITNAADRTANARRATEMTLNTSWVLREDILASPIDWTGALAAETDEATLTRLIRAPRPYQATAVADVVASLAEHERAQLVMACGSGKTLVTLWVAEARADELVLVLVPTLLLLKQFRREWREAATVPFVDLAVCSDADTVEPDEWRVRADELGVPVTTDPTVITAFLRGPGRRVVFATYASSARIAEAQADATVPSFDLVIADEAHRIAGVVNTGVHRERDLRVVLDATRVRAGRRLFATATPRVYSRATRGRFQDLEDIEVASMDDGALFGPVAHRLWFREAVDLDVLTDYELVAVLVADEEVADLVRERAGVIVDGKVVDAETLATLIAVRRAIDDLGLTRAITFHNTIARARGFAHALAQLELTSSAPAAEHISGAMSVDERERVLSILKEPDRPTVVTNARCLTEGIDVPSLDAVAFVDPRSSAVDIVQAVGRVMRRAPGKERGYVVVPVFLREADLADPEAAVESSAFVKVLDVLRALRAHDPELTTDATRIMASLGSRDTLTGGHIAQHIQLLGRTVDPARFERALELHFVELAADHFTAGLGALTAFVAREGHSLVPAAYRDSTGFRLGAWVNTNRWRHGISMLSADRERELEAIPGWSWSPLEDQFQDGMARLRAYAATRGHASPPAALVDDEGFRLGPWVHSRRVDRSRDRLEADKVAALEALPGWTWDPLEDRFHYGLRELRAYVASFGDSRVPSSYVSPGGFKLGRWLNKARQTSRSKPERAALLEALPGWTWNSGDTVFAANLAAIKSFQEARGHARIPFGYATESGLKLGQIVNVYRTAFKAGEMPPERARLLEAAPGWQWDPRTDDFASAVALLTDYAREHGNVDVPRSYRSESGMRLGQWCSARRHEHRQGRLSAQRIAALEVVPGWRWTR